jgi:hypothetical protein
VADDPALIWDDATPARKMPRRAAPPEQETESPAPADPEAAAGMLTLAEAAEVYGVNRSTLRNWCRTGKVDAVLAAEEAGPRWHVDAVSLERHLAGRTGRASRGGAARTPAGPRTEGMLVPRDAWDRLLDQLTHLHEAGQQLAEARERAAKAETEATFLRERLADLRADRDRLREQADHPVPAPLGWVRRLFGGR